MWNALTETLDNGRAQRFHLLCDGKPMAYDSVIRGWRDDDAFRSFFIALLADAPFNAYRWETPPVATATKNRDFEFVLLDAPALNRSPDVNAFTDPSRLHDDGPSILTVTNLGSDAILILPRQAASPEVYVHLASFVRGAPENQKHALWQAVGSAMEDRLSAEPVWLNTSGMGLAWLHVRLDDRPKYYGHRPYKATPP